MTEEGRFQARVKAWLELYKIYSPKQNASALSKTGVPDRLVCIHGLFMGVEIKKNDEEEASPLQQYNIKQIKDNGGVAFVLRPSTFKKFKEITSEFIKTGCVERYKQRVLEEMEVK